MPNSETFEFDEWEESDENGLELSLKFTTVFGNGYDDDDDDTDDDDTDDDDDDEHVVNIRIGPNIDDGDIEVRVDECLIHDVYVEYQDLLIEWGEWFHIALTSTRTSRR